MIYAEIFSFACCDGPLFSSSYYNDGLVNYLDEVDIINKNIQLWLVKIKKTSYPYNSVSRMLKEKNITDKELRNKLDGYNELKKDSVMNEKK